MRRELRPNIVTTTTLRHSSNLDRGNLAIDGEGVVMRDQPKCFTIAYDEIQLGEIIGKGSSSVVIQVGPRYTFDATYT